MNEETSTNSPDAESQPPRPKKQRRLEEPAVARTAAEPATTRYDDQGSKRELFSRDQHGQPKVVMADARSWLVHPFPPGPDRQGLAGGVLLQPNDSNARAATEPRPGTGRTAQSSHSQPQRGLPARYYDHLAAPPMMIGGNALLHPLPPPIGANPNIPGVVYGSLPLGYHPIVMGQQQHPLLDPRLRVPIGGLGAPHDAPSFLQYSSSALGLPYTNIATVPEGERLLAMGELLERERQLSRGLLLETRMTLPSHFLPSVHHGELLGTAMASTAATGTGLGNLALSSTASRTGFPASTVSESDKANGTSGSTGTRVSTASAATILERLPMPPNRARVRIPHFSERAYVPLAIDEDQNWLSELLCFVRSEVVEVFRANVDDLRSRNSSKKICLGQVGIRCRFCAHLPVGSRAGRSSSFPSSLDRIYQSLTMMLRDHFGNCNAMPSPTKEKFLRLKRKTTQ